MIMGTEVYVYVIGTNDRHFTEDGPVKIGVTASPLKRKQHLQVGSPTELQFKGLVIYPSRVMAEFVEKSLHEAFADNRIRGEWFDIPSIDPLVWIDQEALEDERFLGEWVDILEPNTPGISERKNETSRQG